MKSKQLLSKFLEYFDLSPLEAEHVFTCPDCELSGLEGNQEFCQEFQKEFRGWTPPVPPTAAEIERGRMIAGLWRKEILLQAALKFDQFHSREQHDDT